MLTHSEFLANSESPQGDQTSPPDQTSPAVAPSTPRPCTLVSPLHPTLAGLSPP